MPVVEHEGRRLRVSRLFGASSTCLQCGAPFVITSITGRQFYCGDRCKEQAAWRRERLDPRVVASNRARCQRWAAAHRESKVRNPWLLGAPPFGEYLPGGGFDLRVSPPPKWPIEHRSVRALHGLVTGLSGVPHDPTTPVFSLVPIDRGCLWGVVFNDAEIALGLAGKQHPGVLFDRDVVVTCGPLHRVRAPIVSKRGHRLVRIDAITPVHIRKDGGQHTHLFPTARNLISTIAAWLPRRLGITLGDDDIRMRLVTRETQPEHVMLGGKFGRVSGWSGSIVVDTNATGHWLLRCCETYGLGGRTAFGFGRVKVSDVDD